MNFSDAAKVIELAVKLLKKSQQMKAMILITLGFLFPASAANSVTDDIKICRMSLNGNERTWSEHGIEFTYGDHNLSWMHTNNGHTRPQPFKIPKGETVKRVIVDRHGDKVFIATSAKKYIFDSHTGNKIAEVGPVGEEFTPGSTAKLTETTFGSWSPAGYLLTFGYWKEAGGIYPQFFSPHTRLIYDGMPLSNNVYAGAPIRVIWSPSGSVVGVVTESSIPGKFLLYKYNLRTGAMRGSLPIARNGISAGLVALQLSQAKTERERNFIEQNRNNGGVPMSPVSNRLLTEEEIAEAMKGVE